MPKRNLFWRPKGYSYKFVKKRDSLFEKSGETSALGETLITRSKPSFSFDYLCQNRLSVEVPPLWTVLRQTSSLVFTKIEQLKGGTECKISRSVTVHEDLQWQVMVHGRTVSITVPTLQCFPSVLPNQTTLTKLINTVSVSNVCCGNFDQHYIDMVQDKEHAVKGVATVPLSRCGVAFRKDADATAYVEENFNGKSANGEHYCETIRSQGCEILTEKNRCARCTAYRKNLWSTWNRKTTQIGDHVKSSSHTNFRYLNGDQLRDRASNLQKDRIQFKKCHQRLISKLLCQGMDIDKSLDKDLRDIMEEKTEDVSKSFPENSFQRLFWEEQLKQAKCSDARQMRWHPTIIRWCLSLKFSSSAAYETLRKCGFIKLPCSRTLSDFSNFIRPEPGINPMVLEEIIAEAKVDKLEEHQKYVVLLHDEIKIKSDLVFDKNTGQLIGFVNLGKVNEELSTLAKMSEEGSSPQLATHVLVFMVRGVSIRFCTSVAYYPTIGCTADHLFPMIWRVIGYLELTCGLKVIASTSDGATWNRKLYKMHRVHDAPAGFLVYKAINTYTPNDRMIYFFSDVPHLIKTTRNCFANSEAHRKSRSLWNNGNPILWRHLTQVVTNDQNRSIHLLNKIGYEHIELTSFSIMRVNLAAQVLSETVANAIEMAGPPEARETVKFIRYMDRFFDCLNVRNYGEDLRKRKPNLRPYTDPMDPRFEWLQDEFLKYFDDWQQSVMDRGGNFSKSARNAMCISKQTLDGLKMTVKSFIEVSRYLLGQGVEFILSERFCQDPLEAHFSRHRRSGGDNNDPTLQAFGYQENSLRLQKSHRMHCFTGNTGRYKRPAEDPVIDDTRLPKRKRR